MRLRLMPALLVVLGVGCAGGVGDVPDAGDRDAGAVLDSGPHSERDAGLVDGDGGPPVDADAGSAFDAGAGRDAGTGVGAVDGGAPDAGPARDGGGPLDAGRPDSGATAFDAGPPFDWGDAGVPPWRRGLAVWQWVELPNSSLGVVGPTTLPGGSLSGRYSAWSGIAVDATTSRLYVAAAGGHQDYAGNEAYTLDLNAPTPHWVLMREPSPSSVLCSNCAHYLDGRPTSTHLYYTEHFISATKRIMRFGAQATWGDGNGTFPTTDGYDLATNDWVPAGTYGNVVMSGESYGYNEAICKDPVTEDVYAGGAANLYRFSPATGTWSVAAAWPNQGACAYNLPCAVDPVRGKVVYFGNHCLGDPPPFAYTKGASGPTAFSTFTFSGDAALIGALVGAYAGMAYYDVPNSTFVFKTEVRGVLLRVDPVSFVVTEQPTGGEVVPNAENGVYTKFVSVPGLRGYAYLPTPTSNVWFLPNE